MPSSGSSASGFEPTPQQSAVRKLQRIQQRIIKLNTQYSHVLAGFNLALERLSMHLLAAHPLQEGARSPDTKTPQLANQVDRLAVELEGLTKKLDELVQEFSIGHEELGDLLGLRATRPAPDLPATTTPASGGGAPGAAASGLTP